MKMALDVENGPRLGTGPRCESYILLRIKYLRAYILALFALTAISPTLSNRQIYVFYSMCETMARDIKT